MNVKQFLIFKEIQMSDTMQEPLEVRLRRLRLQKKVRNLKRKVMKASKKSSLAMEFLASNNTLIMYVRDKFGFKKGVVLATGPGKIGWSLVSPEDYETVHLNVDQIPKLSGFIHDPESRISSEWEEQLLPAEALEALVRDPTFKDWAASGGWVERPLFDRDTGLTLAINKMRALDAAVDPDKGLDIEDVSIPRDDDLREAVKSMILRSHRYFNDKPHAFETRNSLPIRFESHRDN
jgi:hypothetical protein